MLHLCIYRHLLHFVSLLTIYAVERNVVAYCHAYIKGNGPKLADWSKSICITFLSCFFSLLTSNWEVSIGHFLDSFVNFAENTKKNRPKFVYSKH